MTNLTEHIEVLIFKLKQTNEHVIWLNDLYGEREKISEKISKMVDTMSDSIEAANGRLRTMISAEEWFRDDWHQVVS